MGIARVPEGAVREIGVRAFRFLEAEDVRLVLAEIADDELDAQSHRIDVPGGDGKRHGKIRGGLRCLPGRSGERKPRWIVAHSRALSPPVAELVGGRLVDVEERRVRLGLQIDIEQGDDGLVALRVDHRPLLQRKG